MSRRVDHAASAQQVRLKGMGMAAKPQSVVDEGQALTALFS